MATIPSPRNMTNLKDKCAALSSASTNDLEQKHCVGDNVANNRVNTDQQSVAGEDAVITIQEDADADEESFIDEGVVAESTTPVDLNIDEQDAATEDAVGTTAEELDSSFAANKVFSIPELLENILAGISQIDVFVVQRVSKSFNETIQGSKVLQRKMLIGEESTRREIVSPVCGPSGPVLKIGPMLSNLQRYINSGRLQLVPYTTTNSEWLIGLRLGRDIGQPIGWQGNRAVYITGSWEKMQLGAVKGAVEVFITDPFVRNFRHHSEILPPGATMAMLFKILKECRQSAAAGTPQAPPRSKTIDAMERREDRKRKRLLRG